VRSGEELYVQAESAGTVSVEANIGEGTSEGRKRGRRRSGEREVPDLGGGGLAELARRAVELWERGSTEGALTQAGLVLELAARGGLLGTVATQLAYAAVRRELGRSRGGQLDDRWVQRAKYFAVSRNAVQYVVREVARRVAEEGGCAQLAANLAACCAGVGARLAVVSRRGGLGARLPREEEIGAEVARLRVRVGIGEEGFYVRLGALLAYVLVEHGGIEVVFQLAEKEVERLASIMGGSQTGA